MARTRLYEFVSGIESSVQPDAGTPSGANDLLTKGYVDTLFGSTSVQESLTGAFSAGNTTYTLSHAPGINLSLLAFLGPLFQVQGVHYTISGVTITFTGEDTSATNLNVFYRY
jgi:hypothetical protein